MFQKSDALYQNFENIGILSFQLKYLTIIRCFNAFKAYFER